MKNKIIALRQLGKSYKEIAEELGCSKSLISYYCGQGQKEKVIERTRQKRKNNVLMRRIEHFQLKAIRHKTDDFQRKRDKGINKGRKIAFHYQDVIAKFGESPKCYLTGRPIDWSKPKSYQFDHIIPASKGGSNDIDNLGLACREANIIKNEFTPDELFQLCLEILQHKSNLL